MPWRFPEFIRSLGVFGDVELLHLYFIDAEYPSQLRQLSTDLQSILLEDLGCALPNTIDLFGERTPNHLSLSRQSGSGPYTLSECFPYRAQPRRGSDDESE
jgi:hypothetical protein